MKYLITRRNKRNMPEPATTEEGGADADSRKAGERLAAAVAANDSAEIKEAVFDQNAALTNASMTKVIPTLKTVLETVLKTELEKITTRLDNRDRHDLDRRTEESERRQAQETYLYRELDKLGDILAVSEATATDLKKLFAQVGDQGRALGATLARVDVLEETQQDHALKIAALSAAVTATETRMTAVEFEQAMLRREFQSLITQLGRDKEALRRMSEEPGGGP